MPKEKETGPTTIHCAIYTRKSTDEGLDQEFNSLDAQREAAEAYIASQRHEGWVCLPDQYDDGGFTGANTERPALQRLLSDIKEGGIDCVLVYKVDRLSRSLMDFARLMESFEAHGVSFCSVTQQFNSATSMGRLTLNILLSFAQFEREIISERTRDKIAAAKRKGKWVGGIPVLGYDIDPKGGKLVVNDEEGARVRAMFQLYLEHEAMMPVVKELDRRAWRTKEWTTKKKGNKRGGKPITKNVLYTMLNNVVYLGKVKYKEEIYDGEHESIIDFSIWKRVQDLLRENGRTGGVEVRNKYGALLRGLIRCVPCNSSMSHTYTKKGEKRYRYYVCTNAQKRGWDACPSKSLNAHEIETSVIEHIKGIGASGQVLDATVKEIRNQMDERVKELRVEHVTVKKGLARQNGRVLDLVNQSVDRGPATSDVADRLANLNDQIASLEKREAVLREELATAESQALDEEEVASLLSSFGPIWQSLPPRDQIRIIRLIVDRVDFDGRDRTVRVVFQSTGLMQLCQEFGETGEEEE